MRETNVTIAVVAPQEPFEFYDLFWEGAWSAAYELAPLGVRVLTVSSGVLDAEAQERDLRDLLSEQVQAIVLVAADSSRLNPLIAQHTQRNTPVVTALRDAPASRRMAFVGSDFRHAGSLAGEYMSKIIKPCSHIVAITGNGNSTDQTLRYEGFTEALRESKVPMGITEFANGSDFAAVMNGGGRKFDALYIGCPETAPMQQILSQITPPAKCVTFDLTDVVKPFLASGVISAVVDSSRYYQGYIAVQKAYECLQTNSLDTAWVPIPNNLVLAGNLEASQGIASTNSIFEALVHQRTLQLRSYKQALETANSRLMRMAETDPLTDALNRRKFEEVLGEEMAKGTEVSTLVIDIDDFQSLNEVLGEAVGDQVLRAVADTLQASCSSVDVIARISGDEFGVILPDTSANTAWNVRDRLITAIRETRISGHPDIHLSASIGVGSMPGRARTPGELIEAAERNLYSSKRGKRTLLQRVPRVG